MKISNGPLVSIIIPTYNRVDIGRCIFSILKQTYRNIEIILIDDGSYFLNIDEVEILTRNYSVIHIVHSINKGVSFARNLGIKYANGDYICFVDSDDYVEKDFVEKLLYKIHSTKSDLSCCCFNILSKNQIRKKNHHFQNSCIDGKENINRKILEPLVSSSDEKTSLLTNVTGKIYKKSVIIDNSITFNNDVYYGEDWLFNLNFINKTKRISFIEDHLYYYDVTTNDSLSKMFSNKNFDSLVILWEEVRNLFNNLRNSNSYIYIYIIQNNSLKNYVHINGLKKYSKFVKYLFNNEMLEKTYNSSYKGNILYKIFSYSFIKRKYNIFLLMCFIVSLKTILKFYVKKVIYVFYEFN